MSLTWVLNCYWTIICSVWNLSVWSNLTKVSIWKLVESSGDPQASGPLRWRRPSAIREFFFQKKFKKFPHDKISKHRNEDMNSRVRVFESGDMNQLKGNRSQQSTHLPPPHQALDTCSYHISDYGNQLNLTWAPRDVCTNCRLNTQSLSYQSHASHS